MYCNLKNCSLSQQKPIVSNKQKGGFNGTPGTPLDPPLIDISTVLPKDMLVVNSCGVPKFMSGD